MYLDFTLVAYNTYVRSHTPGLETATFNRAHSNRNFPVKRWLFFEVGKS